MQPPQPRVVLGIDAAWTTTQPSGVALAMDRGDGWRLVAAAPSYGHFCALAETGQLPTARPIGRKPDALEILSAAEQIGGTPVDLVAIDMPLSRLPISGRREADNAVSRSYGARKCSTHTPSPARPGQISDDLRTAFGLAGYALQVQAPVVSGLVEVYPHPALVELMEAAERLPYKAGKVRNYWRHLWPAERKVQLLAQWAAIAATLDTVMPGSIAAILRADETSAGAHLKACEDLLDAIICAWVGTTILSSQARPFGEDTAAIWIPTPPTG
ncbi:DUF429 domain-containing protein [Sphingobium yanoikuyae]|uniref:DUF429 domain-containing protein n=1 Tax=Sphingobium yanoikuyae TaxID=13690 RepID=UPI0004E43A35|nr:DUF429 domain-containing protein [Sphingobium yanoikuyae]KFD26149.1 hypothetical protein IH86_21565 [Sphingobium yanoikuyae]